MVRTFRGKKPPRAAKATAIAINNILARARARKGKSSIGAEVKKRKKTVKRIKVKKLLSKPKLVKVKKGGVVVRKRIIRRKSHYPGNYRTFY